MRLFPLIILTSVVMTSGYFYMKNKSKNKPKSVNNNNPKNVRNNNPLNMKESADWKGERVLNLDKTFEEFTTPEYGFRAGYIDLLQKLERGLNTVESIIAVWAPSPEREGDDHNDTAEYIEYVADKMNISEFQEINPSDLPEMMLAMSDFEGAKGYFTIEQAKQGEQLAQQEGFVINRLSRMGVYA